MKLIQQTPTVQRLEIQKFFPIWLVNVGAGLLFLVPWIYILLTGENLTVLQCNRLESKQIDCEISRSSWLQTYDFALVKDLQSAEIKRSLKGRKFKERIVLNTTQDQLVLVSRRNSTIRFFLDYNTKRLHYFIHSLNYDTKKINDFIHSSEKERLDIYFDDRWWHGFLFIPLIIFFIVIFYQCLTVKILIHCVFDRETKKIYITYKKLFKPEIQEIEFENIIRAKVTRNRTGKADFNYTLSLVKSTNKVVKLETTTDSRGHYDEIAKSINHFLGRTSGSREQ